MSKEVFRYGYVAIDQEESRSGNLDRSVAIALISLRGDNLELFALDSLKLVEYDPTLVAEEMLKPTVIDYWIDEENYSWLSPSFDNVSSKVFNQNPKRLLPTLRSYQRSSEIILRQLSVLQPIRKSNSLIIAQSIKQDPLLVEQMDRVGSAATDAIAGAITVATEQREIIYQNLANDLEEEEPEWLLKLQRDHRD